VAVAAGYLEKVLTSRDPVLSMACRAKTKFV